MQLQGMVSTDNNSNEIVIVMKKQILKIKMSGYHELEQRKTYYSIISSIFISSNKFHNSNIFSIIQYKMFLTR